MDYLRADAKQAARESFSGLWAAMTTPFTQFGDLDEAALVRDIAHLTDELEVDGVFCTGVMAEFWSLSQAERRSAVEVVVEATRGRCPVLAHTGHHSAGDTIELTRHATAAGADFVVVINPYYPAGSEEGMREWFLQVLNSVDIGVWLFDTSYSGVSLPIELIDRLADVENVCGIKVGHDHARYLEVLQRVGDRILVCEPSETAWLSNMREHGQRVFMSSAAPFLYQTASWRPMREYTRLALAGDFAEAAEVAATLEPIRTLAEKWLHGKWARDRVNPVPYIKAWAGLLGMAGGPVRPPLPQLSEDEQRELAADLETAGIIGSAVH
ncbi:MAG TPA: dihydrodipicolinate synthase family protein [Jatrophihabitans sp.]|jgi:4-hydroxy-tetrahydrodipicolinate synthase